MLAKVIKETDLLGNKFSHVLQHSYYKSVSCNSKGDSSDTKFLKVLNKGI